MICDIPIKVCSMLSKRVEPAVACLAPDIASIIVTQDSAMKPSMPVAKSATMVWGSGWGNDAITFTKTKLLPEERNK